MIGTTLTPGKPFLLLAGLALLGSLPVPAVVQGQDRTLVDRIAAVVGDSVIVTSQIEERIFQLQSQGVEVPTDPDAMVRLRRDLLDQMIGEQLIVQAALQDTTIVVDEAEVENMITQDLDQRAAGMGGPQVFQEALARDGWTPATFREYLRGQARAQQLYQQYMAKRVREIGTVVVEEAEIRQFFEEQRESIGSRPPAVTFIQVIVVPTPSDSAKEAARAEAERIRQMAVDGEDFGQLARRFSQDPGSKDMDGDLGWFRRGVMVDAFEEAAFNLAVNEISQPVESPFGFHVIRMDRRRSAEVRASHILIMVSPDSTDGDRARERAGEVRSRLGAGEDYEALREEYGDPGAPDTLTVTFDRLQELPPGFAEPLIRSNPGDLIGPLEYAADRNTHFAVLKVLEVTEGGEYTLDDEDLRRQIRSTLQQQKIVDQILDELRSKTYIQIRM